MINTDAEAMLLFVTGSLTLLLTETLFVTFPPAMAVAVTVASALL